MRTSLNGTWEFLPDSGVGHGAGADADDGARDAACTITVPTWWDSLQQTTGYPAWWERGLHHAVYRRSVTLDEAALADDLFLHVGAVASLAKAYVNGVSVGPESTKGYLMTLLPYDLDITKAAHAGVNEIAIEVWSVKALPADALAAEGGPDRLLFPFGTENIVGRVGIGGDVWVESRPRLRVDDVQVMPDLNRNADPSDDRLALNVTIVNHTADDADLDVRAVVRPWSADGASGAAVEPALTLPGRRVHVAAGDTAVVATASAWPDAHYWSRTDPFLYTVDASIAPASGDASDAADGPSAEAAAPTPLHTKRERFGFRQFWREGDRFYFNGVPIRLRGDSLCLLNQGNRDLINEIGDANGVILDDNHASDAMVRAWVDAYRHANANVIRNHIRSVVSPVLFDHADETGMLIEEETAFWNPGSVSNVSLDPPYYLNYSDEAIGYYAEWVDRWVKAFRNHPSIIMWSTTNEAWNPNDADVLIPPLEEAANRADPTRMVYNDGFNRPRGNEDSRHYFGGYPSGMTNAPDIYALYHIDSDLPLGAGEEFSVSTAGIPQYADDGTIRDIYHGRLDGNPDTISRADFIREVGRVTRGIRTTRMSDWRPFCMSMFLYDNIEKVVRLDQEHTPHGLNPKTMLRPQFDPTADGDARWIEGDGLGYFAASYADVAAYDKEYDREPRLGTPHRTYRPDETSARTIIVHNDEEIDGTALDLSWTVSALDPATGAADAVDTGEARLAVPYGEHVEHGIVIHVPGDSADAPGDGAYDGRRLILTLRVAKQGVGKFSEDNFLGWIGRPAPVIIGASRTLIDLGTVDWASREVRHCIHLTQQGGAMSEHWTARILDDADGAIGLERDRGNLRHEQETFYTVNTAGLIPGRAYEGLIEYAGDNDDRVEIRVRFTAGDPPEGDDAANRAAGAAVSVSSSAAIPGWSPAALVDGRFDAAYNHFGWSSEPQDRDHAEQVTLRLARPARIAQIVLAPRGENPGGTVAEAFHGDGEGVGGVLEFAAGHKAADPNRGQGFPVDFTLSVSADGRDWRTVVERRDQPLPANGTPRAYDFDPVDDVRWIRLDATRLRPNPHEGGRYALQLVEIAAYGDAHMPAIPSRPCDVTAAVADDARHDVHASWRFASDGRSPILGSTLTLTNEAGETIPVTVAGEASDAHVADVPDGRWTLVVQDRNAVGDGEPSEPFVFAVGRGDDAADAAGADGADAGAAASDAMPTVSAPAQADAQLDSETGAVAVSWTACAGADGYVVHLTPTAGVGGRGDAALPPSRVTWAPAGATTAILPSVATGTYTASVDACVERPAAGDGYATTRSVASAPSAPVIVAHAPSRPNKPGVTSVGDRMSVTWSAPADGGTPITSYVLTITRLTDDTVQVVRADGDATAATIERMEPGNYTASVIAVNAIGMSGESSPSLPCLIK
ncbi:fibronectin type III domain-containing protein [Bifidobacterium samirii]|uniref:Uncharacterized protein n=1 Tax=Bifidobacterium samirii TaxID=2306974 RepID=A0A430FWN3_9BIFI|nr:fibronectin type III domain-containing protein [Bifidobacterium samirii]RSX58514.1 hypothetical protein D2E24_0393 [Bifidobacterium samirii]